MTRRFEEKDRPPVARPPANCYFGDGIGEPKCQELCTSYSWCIAYSSGYYSHSSHCALVTSTGSCPDGGVLKHGDTATSIDQLVPCDVTQCVSGFACRGKVEHILRGNIKLIVNSSSFF